MPHARLISPEFWTSEAVVDCAPMTRLLLLGLSTFADDFGVLPLRPRTLRLQVFPGDTIDNDRMCAMIDELAAHGLVRRFTVDDVEYLSIVDWEIHQRVGKRARRRHPAPPSARESALDDGIPLQCPSSGPSDDAPFRPDAAGDEAAAAAWHEAVEGALRRAWGADVPADVALHAARWRAEGRDLTRDVLPAIIGVTRLAVELNQPLRLELVDGAMARTMPPVAMAQTIESHGNRAA